MAYVRQDINFPLTPLDVKNLNDNTRYLWTKSFGDISLTDMANDVKQELYSNWLQPQGEGNLDSTHPFYIRFYIPENTKTIKRAYVNLMTSRYRLDSDIAQANSESISISGITIGQITTSSSGASTTTTTASDGGQTKTSSSGGSSSTTSGSSSSNTTGYPTGLIGEPTTYDTTVNELGVAHHHAIGVPSHSHGMSHTHTVNVPAHSHNVDIDAHTHNMEHYHTIDHSHEINSSMTLPAHTHDINFGIKDATVDPNGVKLYVNEIYAGITLNGDGQVCNNLDITSQLAAGWNILKITSSNIARVTLYGIVEVLQIYR